MSSQLPPQSNNEHIQLEEAAVFGLLQKLNINRELFLPIERCRWDGEKLTFGKNSVTSDLKKQFVGVRLQEPDPQNIDRIKEQAVQNDLVSLVKSIQEIRKKPETSGIVLSSENLIGTDPGKTTRIRFGLASPPDGKFKLNESEAANECYTQIIKAIEKAGFKQEPTKPFEPSRGFVSLLDWASSVRFRKFGIQLPKNWWYACFLPLLFTPLCCNPFSCSGPDAEIFGQAVKNDFIIILDKSDSMKQFFDEVASQAQSLLNNKIKNRNACNMDFIAYDGSAKSYFQEIKSIKSDDVGQLISYLHSLQSGGGTDLSKAIDLAAKEVVRHKKKTTLYVFTDGADSSIPEMVKNAGAIKKKFEGVEVVINMTTPRLASGKEISTPQIPEEVEMEKLAKIFNGKFGPSK